MSSKMWEITLDHARSCVLDSSVHLYPAPGFQKKTAVVFNVVAQVLGLLVDFQYIPAEKLSEIEKALILSLSTDFSSIYYCQVLIICVIVSDSGSSRGDGH